MERPIKISPSLLSCDYSKLKEEISEIEALGADMLHIDVMDGHFVPNITIGAPVVRSLRKVTNICFDVHLMITNPLLFVDDFADAGADIITVHTECFGGSCPAEKAIEKIKDRGVKAAFSLKPNTPAKSVFPFLDDIDMVLVMTVEPGFAGQDFKASVLPKITEIRMKKPDIDIQVDGGINDKTAKLCIQAGANVLVAGSYIFGASDRGAAIASLRK
ncbi:MAG: Ribulose-phosphate 3-epimerase [Firmicutes bacterium ADurb.Bin300]|nr:MAG: Ribulose-phosphate 3-epimerase [Firmicutes bacterium ADurb.Bin300]